MILLTASSHKYLSISKKLCELKKYLNPNSLEPYQRGLIQLMCAWIVKLEPSYQLQWKFICGITVQIIFVKVHNMLEEKLSNHFDNCYSSLFKLYVGGETSRPLTFIRGKGLN